MQQHRSNSYLFGGNAPYVEEMYEAYLDNPGSVPENWRKHFDALQHVPAAGDVAFRELASVVPNEIAGNTPLVPHVIGGLAGVIVRVPLVNENE